MLTLVGLSNDSIEEPSAEEKRLINAVVRSGISKCIDFHSNYNASWFAHSEAQSHLFDFFREQTCLRLLNLAYNKFSNETTASFFSMLLESSCIGTINSLGLYGSCDFSSDETCSIFASFIDSAEKL